MCGVQTDFEQEPRFVSKLEPYAHCKVIEIIVRIVFAKME